MTAELERCAVCGQRSSDGCCIDGLSWWCASCISEWEDAEAAAHAEQYPTEELEVELT